MNSVNYNLRFIIPLTPLVKCFALGLIPYVPIENIPSDFQGKTSRSMIQEAVNALQHNCAGKQDYARHMGGPGDVIHLVVGFMLDDYEQAADTEIMRKHKIREAIGLLIRSIEKENQVCAIEWMGALHLDTSVPHVHVAISRYALDHELRGKRIIHLTSPLFSLN